MRKKKNGFLNNLRKIWKKFDSSIATLASMIAIGTLFFDMSPAIKYILMIIVMLYLQGLGIYVVRAVLVTDNAKRELDKDYSNRNLRLASKLHKFYHNIRNETASIDTLKIMTYRDVVDKCRSICDYLAVFYKILFSKYLGEYDISVCIKLVKTDIIFDDEYMNWKMETIARSSTTEQGRSNIDNKPIRIAENTDFQVILSNKYKDELFSFSDMRNIKKDFLNIYKMEYKNSRENFLSSYRSTIVVPIMIDGEHVSSELIRYSDSFKRNNLVLGFLCIDSMKVFETKEEKNVFALGMEYSKSFADSLYLFFEKILLSCMDYARMEQETKDEIAITNEKVGQDSGISSYNSKKSKGEKNEIH